MSSVVPIPTEPSKDCPGCIDLIPITPEQKEYMEIHCQNTRHPASHNYGQIFIRTVLSNGDNVCMHIPEGEYSFRGISRAFGYKGSGISELKSSVSSPNIGGKLTLEMEFGLGSSISAESIATGIAIAPSLPSAKIVKSTGEEVEYNSNPQEFIKLIGQMIKKADKILEEEIRQNETQPSFKEEIHRCIDEKGHISCALLMYDARGNLSDYNVKQMENTKYNLEVIKALAESYARKTADENKQVK